ncbi:MAG: hypothetical protein WD971_12915, partial [Pirellulales bacterium]
PTAESAKREETDRPIIDQVRVPQPTRELIQRKTGDIEDTRFGGHSNIFPGKKDIFRDFPIEESGGCWSRKPWFPSSGVVSGKGSGTGSLL